MMKITEIIPNDLPEWVEEAIRDGQYFNATQARIKELESKVKDPHIYFDDYLGHDRYSVPGESPLYLLWLWHEYVNEIVVAWPAADGWIINVPMDGEVYIDGVLCKGPSQNVDIYVPEEHIKGIKHIPHLINRRGINPNME